MKKRKFLNEPKLIPAITARQRLELMDAWEKVWHKELCKKFHAKAKTYEYAALAEKLPALGFDPAGIGYDAEIEELKKRYAAQFREILPLSSGQEKKLSPSKQNLLLYEFSKLNKGDPDLAEIFPVLAESAEKACDHPLLDILRDGFFNYVEIFRQQSNVKQQLDHPDMNADDWAERKKALEIEKENLDDKLAEHTRDVFSDVRKYIGNIGPGTYSIARSITGSLIHETIPIARAQLGLPEKSSVPQIIL